MKAEDIRSYAHRRWDLVGTSKAAYWAEEKPRLGPIGALRIADGLRRQALAQHGDGPSEAERADDLRTHAAVSGMLRLGRAHRGD